MGQGYTRVASGARAVTVKEVDRSRIDRHHRWMADIDLTRLLLEAQRALGSEFAEQLVERGYEDARPGHGAILMTIDRRSGTRLTELARRARITKQGMMLLVDELESRGYLRRIPDPDDARAKIVRLTARGRRYVAEARRIAAGMETRIRRDLGQRDYATFRSALEYVAGVEDGSGGS
jgi:DNA-binding MarR family transcriptional regulator